MGVQHTDGIRLNRTQVCLLLFLCCQNATAPVITRLSRSGHGGEGMGQFRVQNLIVVMELIKLTVCIGV